MVNSCEIKLCIVEINHELVSTKNERIIDIKNTNCKNK